MTPDKNKPRKYAIEPYNPEWANQFELIKKDILSAFGDLALEIEHIGSTSIPGMWAKPLIDVMVIVENIESLFHATESMKSMGYECGENYIAPRTMIFYKTGKDDQKLINIHVCEPNSYKIKQFIALRDFLRTFPEKAQEYSEFKKHLYAKHPDSYVAYREEKGPFLTRLVQEAFAWYDQKNFEAILKNEGFPIIYSWHDDPGTVYESHIHRGRVSFYVTNGSVTFSGGINKTVSAGERIDVPPGIAHSALVGPEGCDYIVGQEIEGDA